MISLFQLTYPGLLYLISGIVLVLLLQMFCFIHVFFSFRFRRSFLWRCLLDASILLHLFLLLVFASEAAYQMQSGFLWAHSRAGIRIFLFAVLSCLSIGLAVQEKSLYPLGIAAAAALTLPAVERCAGSAFPLVLTIALFFWFFLIVNQLFLFHIQRSKNLSAFSVKEAVDTLDFGILFCRADHKSDGQVLLTNRKMQELIFALTGAFSYNGKAFYESLQSGKVLPGCTRCAVEGQLAYTLPDGRVWWFRLERLDIDACPCAVLTASDITEEKQVTDTLDQADTALNQRNQELNIMLQNMHSLCQSEETLRAKNRVHDLLGQQISLFLRAIREHREPDEALLQSFANGLLQQLRTDVGREALSLRAIAKSFHSIGVDVQINGVLPTQPDLQQVFTEIATEAMTNAVRHGYATRICVSIRCVSGCWEMRVTDNGIPKDEPIQEGGGLRAMRRKVQQAGGQFSYQSRPSFEILAKIPGGKPS